MDALTTPFLTGTATGAILLLAALGLTLTFGQMGVINMANGEFLMAGAYVDLPHPAGDHQHRPLDRGRHPGGLRRRRPPRAAARGLASSSGCTNGRSTRCW